MIASTANTRSLRSRYVEDASKKTLPVEKGLNPRAPERASKLPASSSGTNTASLVHHVSTRSSTKHDPESALHTSTPEKSTAREIPASKSASRSPSPKLVAVASDLQVRSDLQSVQDVDGLDNKKSQNVQSASPITTSPISTRSRSGLASSPEKHNQDTDASHGFPWCKKATVITYQRRHKAGKMRARGGLRSSQSRKTHVSNAADVSHHRRYGRPGKVEKVHTTDGSRSETSGEDVKSGSGETEKTVRRRHDVAVQANSQSSASSPRLLRHSKLHSVSSSLASSSSLRSRRKAVVESSSSCKTAVTAKSSVQYDTCFETASSQPQISDLTDEDELDQLARLAHGSPQSAVVPQSSEDETVTSSSPKKSLVSQMKRRSTTHSEQLPQLSALGGENPTTVCTQFMDAVADNMSDSDRGNSGKKRRREIERKQEEHSPKSGRDTCHLAVGGSRKTVKNASNITASPQHRSRIDHIVKFSEEMSSSRVENSSVEPIAGPSGIALRIQNASKERSHASG